MQPTPRGVRMMVDVGAGQPCAFRRRTEKRPPGVDTLDSVTTADARASSLNPADKLGMRAARGQAGRRSAYPNAAVDRNGGRGLLGHTPVLPRVGRGGRRPNPVGSFPRSLSRATGLRPRRPSAGFGGAGPLASSEFLIQDVASQRVGIVRHANLFPLQRAEPSLQRVELEPRREVVGDPCGSAPLILAIFGRADAEAFAERLNEAGMAGESDRVGHLLNAQFGTAQQAGRLAQPLFTQPAENG